MKEVIKKPIKITSFSYSANFYRNAQRTKVDKLFNVKNNSKGEKRRKFDFLARQLWRNIILRANTL